MIMQAIIRKAEIKDIAPMLEIYNYEVEHGVATLDLHPKTLEEWTDWFKTHDSKSHCILTAVMENQVVGYASLSPYREKEAYRSTVELSLYVSPAYRRRGIASWLMEAILESVRNDAGIHTVVSVITRGNQASERLHEKYGFAFCGTIHQVGMKFGKYLDIDNYEWIKQE